ncbi:MAG: putative rane protein, partial [Bacteroidetes bacterium]|nr:putative rane protein [Bacteroidota bacterium]
MELLLGLIFGLIPIGLVVLLIVYISKTNVLQQKLTWIEMELHRLRQLEDEVAALKSKAMMQKPGGESPILTQKDAMAVPQQGLRTLGDEIAELRGKAVGQKPSTEPLAVAHPTVTPVHAQAKPSRTREEWEALIGGKLLNRIGALALIIGVGFFLKYAFDNEWITETMRVVIGFLIGALLLVVAMRADKKKFEVFAQGLVGSGIAVLYLSVFASFSFYRLVPQVVAFMMMSAVTVLAFLQAFKYDSLAVSLLGLVGGFLTPFLLSTGEANEVGLFTYIALLDAGIFAVL